MINDVIIAGVHNPDFISIDIITMAQLQHI